VCRGKVAIMVQSTTGIKESIIELILAFYSASSFFGVAEKNKGDKNKCGCASNTKLLHVHRLSRRYFLLPDTSNSLFLSLCLYTLHSAPENNEKNVCFYVWVIDDTFESAKQLRANAHDHKQRRIPSHSRHKRPYPNPASNNPGPQDDVARAMGQ
jgi:hypothetical protein